MQKVTFKRFLWIMAKRLRWWLIIHRKGIKATLEWILFGAAVIGIPLLMFVDWLLWGYDTTPRENILTAIILIYAGWKLWK